MSPGYDPAWSLDGRFIAYIRARYTSDADGCLYLEGAPGKPAAWDEIRLWDLETGKDERLQLANLKPGSAFLWGLVWADESRLAFIAADPHRSESSREEDADWGLLSTYRRLPAGVLLADVRSRRGSILLRTAQFLQIERSADGELAVWYAPGDDPSPSSPAQWSIPIVTIDTAGRTLATQTIPEGRWRSSCGALGTLLATHPVMVRESRNSGYLLTEISAASTRDLHSSKGTIKGVFGSPDGCRLAVLVDRSPSSSTCELMVLAPDNSQPKLVAEDAFEQSRVAWAPNGRQIAYVSSEDGHITIVDLDPADEAE